MQKEFSYKFENGGAKKTYGSKQIFGHFHLVANLICSKCD